MTGDRRKAARKLRILSGAAGVWQIDSSQESALINNAILLTRNESDFGQIVELRIEMNRRS
jgi:hypothetical protein